MVASHRQVVSSHIEPSKDLVPANAKSDDKKSAARREGCPLRSLLLVTPINDMRYWREAAGLERGLQNGASKLALYAQSRLIYWRVNNRELGSDLSSFIERLLTKTYSLKGKRLAHLKLQIYVEHLTAQYRRYFDHYNYSILDVNQKANFVRL
jgi:hypothetical protein